MQSLYKEIGADWGKIAKLIPEEMVNEFTFAGTPEEVFDQWVSVEKDYQDRGVSEIVFQTVGSDDVEEETIENLHCIVTTFARE